jgi:hypothetical protein
MAVASRDAVGRDVPGFNDKFAEASDKDDSVAQLLPMSAQFVGVRREVAQRGAATRKVNDAAKKKAAKAQAAMNKTTDPSKSK